ncbi:hypothetical protein CP532_5227 [Ophiocordyceps camponoti-leonardi (nom. inval.)]|nr:hypothetical protein CP532_5227 [Ophiocordyceps camponoti-leonardi (nom. inval.)]
MSHRMFVLLASFTFCLLLWPCHCEATPLSNDVGANSTGTWSRPYLVRHRRLASHGHGLPSVSPPRPSTPPGSPPTQHHNAAPLPVIAPLDSNSRASSPSSQDSDEVPSIPPPPVPEEPQTADNTVIPEQSLVPDETQPCTASEQKVNGTEIASSKPSKGFLRGACRRLSFMVKKPKQKGKPETSAAELQEQEVASESTAASSQASPRRRRGAFGIFSKKEKKGNNQAEASSSKPDENMAVASELAGPSDRRSQYHIPRNVAGTLKRKQRVTKSDPLYLHPQLRGEGEW